MEEKIIKDIIKSIKEEINIQTIFLQRETRNEYKRFRKGIIEGLNIARTIIKIERILNEQ